ncbi:ANTAR domain-containing response regulator [Paraburkholderia fungorum]|jgi:AmiR/NasT family two-component response regulator|uniref:ANTAR domain protein n=1 Tax=Paraburkholderia fungorum TaxID=134537 RepID=A0AAP5Q589_9BURK|nr:ANTAR domain-containing protein [Paraburkholderia fungorum]AJZ63348.1 ANTAR domain protein [Paraburkholderia fungorum]MBB4512419.1 AmiR/NasT family two-component response regulator [Paraburkholderia fungorum]MBB6200325.1 AmiR/NasT family two-component response regulator [Paraburkholderia fungorum]MBU7438004.1 ANTAR domain-containing protein [Paraburkholderia fungorum]MDT8836934.1 ANTAR domain-containing protein [Paraburkholderia fungorum]
MKQTAQTPAILRDLRSLKVVVIHPQDQDGEELLAQLQRIGCDVQVCWPRLDSLPCDTGLVVMAMRPETLSVDYPWLGTSTSPPVIPVVTYENPITIEAVLRLNAFATIPSPVRSFGLLTAIAVALTQFKASRARERYIERLEQKQAKVRVIQQATRIVMDSRGMSEGDAYQLLRSQAMLKREQIETVAGDIVKAHETLSF